MTYLITALAVICCCLSYCAGWLQGHKDGMREADHARTNEQREGWD
jgi:hypothetical protein